MGAFRSDRPGDDQKGGPLDPRPSRSVLGSGFSSRKVFGLAYADVRAVGWVEAMSAEERPQGGQLAAEISNAVVRTLARTTGRGPTKAKTTLGDNGVFVVLQDSLTRGEQTLADAGEGDAVLDLRRRWQRVMKEDMSHDIEELTGRKVIGFMSDNHIDPDLAVEVFVLEALPTAEGADH